MGSHDATVTHPSPLGGYWWACTCGDEGGPYEAYEEAWNATVDHEREG